jgi:hypothetical protein
MVDVEQQKVGLVTPRDLGEDVAMGNWCQNISVECAGGEVPELLKSESVRQSAELLGESSTPTHLPSPHPSMGDHPPPPLSLEERSPEEVDCRVAQGSIVCSVLPPKGTSVTKHWCTNHPAADCFVVSHQALVHLTASAA